MTTEDRDDDWMYGPGTLAARAVLVSRLTSDPRIASARVTCDAAPLQIEGELDDERQFYFRARWGTAALSIAPVGYSPIDAEVRTEHIECSQWMATEDVGEAFTLFAALLALLEVHPRQEVTE
ncbi:hypothetical protein NQK81_01475 [Amycolatopsis roodepoortensis]|uniref:hypothetical protein n=1 Tax=Amycolatopsis roodepoortensis TaxID=700274 RepID=UPI00214AD7EB|nr:hypothetical protein [Amycolatopsis roodepoortensis]UUV32146.1 hypothetical protein NQK81_01475 [Amycolatopsis roodepoortensis]